MRKKNERQIFTLFAKLPKELQLKIIKAALDEPRLIEVQYKHRNEYRSRTLVPGLLHTSREIRGEIINKCGYDRFPASGETPSVKHTFINWEKDILFFNTFASLRGFASAAPDVVKHKCQNLAIRLSDIGRFNEDVGWNGLGNIKKMVLLRQITNVSENSKDLVLKALPNPDWPGVHRSAMEAAATFLISSSDPNRALRDCITMDATRDNELKRKSDAGKQKERCLEEDEKNTLSAEDALLAAQ